MKKLICLFFAVLFVSAFALCGCTNDDSETVEPTTAETVAATEATAGEPVDEEGAKAVVLEDAGIPETAAENLEVKLENGAYIITFAWSGFEYQYTINASTGEITETLFDGSVI